MTAPVPTALPFGMKDCKIYPYLDQQGTILADEGFDLPNSQTFSFADSEDYTDLRGDDELVATHGNGAQVNWTLEAGGISLQIWALFTGGQIIETGTAPNRVITLRKLSDDIRPYFKVVGQIMSDSGGDVQATVYRAKCNGDISGQFGDGQFFITSADGIGLPIPGTRLLYDIAQHEARVFLSTTATANPIMPPRNIGLASLSEDTAVIIWEPVSGMTGYRVALSANDGDTWITEGAAATNEIQRITVTGTPAAGTYTLTFDGHTTTAIPYGAVAATIQAALVALPNIDVGDVTVAGTTPTINITFGGNYAGENVPAITLTPTGITGGTLAISTPTQGDAGDVDDPNITLSGLTPDNDYLVRVASKIGTDTGGYSQVVSFRTLPAS